MLLATLLVVVMPRPSPIGQTATFAPTNPAVDFKFTENKGQWNPQAKFMAHTNAVDVWVTSTGVVYNWRGPSEQRAATKSPLSAKPNNYSVSVDFVGATGEGKPVGMSPRPGHENFYRGKTKAVNVRSFAQATIQDLYKGIDLVTYFDEQEKRPRYDLVVHPGADPNQIRMKFGNAKNLTVDQDGAVNYETKFGKVKETRQMAYQKADSGPDFHFFPQQVKNADGTVSFDVAGYKKDRTLVIDPVVWATYLGGANGDDLVTSIKVDASQNAYVAGLTDDFDFPTTNSNASAGVQDAFVAKFDALGNCLYSTFYGGSGFEGSANIGFDAFGNAYTSGTTESTDLFVTDGSTPQGESQSGFLAKFDGSGQILYSKYLTSFAFDSFFAEAMAVTPEGIVDIAGQGSFGINILLETYQIDPLGGLLTHGAFGFDVGSVAGVALDPSGNVFVLGTTNMNDSLVGGYQGSNGNAAVPVPADNMFVIKLDPNQNGIVSGTYLGGVGETTANGLAIDASGNIFVSGTTNYQGIGGTFPVTPGALSVGTLANAETVSKLSNDLSTLLASGLFSGPNGGIGGPLVLDSSGSPIIEGQQFGGGSVPLTWDYFSGHYSGLYIARLSSNLDQELYGTDFGNGSMFIDALAVDANGRLYIGGEVGDDEVPTTTASYQQQYPGGFPGFITVLDPTVIPGLQRVTSDRGVAPSMAGGVGKILTVSVYYAEPDGTTISLTSPDTRLRVSSSNTVITAGQSHVATFDVVAADVAVPTPITLVASDGTNQLPLTVTLQPFVKLLVTRPFSAAAGTTFTAYVTTYEIPQTNQLVQLTSDPAFAIVGSPTLLIPGILGGASANGALPVTLQVASIGATQTGTLTATMLSGASSASTSFTFVGPSLTSAAFVGNTLTMTLSSPVIGQSYTFTSGTPAISPDLVVTVNGTTGSANANPIEVFNAAAFVQVNYTITVNGVKKTVPLKITPNAITAFQASPAVVVEGSPTLFSANFRTPLLANGTFQATSSSSATIGSFQTSAPGGANGFNVAAITHSTFLTAPKTVTLSAQWVGPTGPSGPVTVASVTVLPLLNSVNLSSLQVQGGGQITGTMFLNGPNQTATPSFTVTSSNANAYFGVPGTLSTTVATGSATFIPFTINTKTVTKNTAVTITLPTPLGYKTKSFNITLTP